MEFDQALQALKRGEKLTRTGWNGKNMCVQLQIPDVNSKMTQPYIYLAYPAGSETAQIPWVASQSDILASDWAIIETEETEGVQE